MTKPVDKYRDVPDYILGITREIWEERGVGPALRRYYADNVLVRAANGLCTSNRQVEAATLQTLHEFPDRRLIGEDVLWTGDEASGYLSSHRLLSVKRHSGSGMYGNATSKTIRSRIIAECFIRGEQVVEEWLVRDQAAFANGLGMTPRDLAHQQAEQDLATAGKIVYFTPEIDVAGNFVPSIDDSGVGGRYAAGWREIWNDKHPAVIRSLYDKNCTVNIPGGDTLESYEDIDRFVIGYLASFPDAQLEFDQLMVNRVPGMPPRVASRWSMRATHSGWGHFGMPTGAPVYIMGLTHAHIDDDRITNEWILIDEVAVWKQIIAHQGMRQKAAVET